MTAVAITMRALLPVAGGGGRKGAAAGCTLGGESGVRDGAGLLLSSPEAGAARGSPRWSGSMLASRSRARRIPICVVAASCFALFCHACCWGMNGGRSVRAALSLGGRSVSVAVWAAGRVVCAEFAGATEILEAAGDSLGRPVEGALATGALPDEAGLFEVGGEGGLSGAGFSGSTIKTTPGTSLRPAWVRSPSAASMQLPASTYAVVAAKVRIETRSSHSALPATIAVGEFTRWRCSGHSSSEGVDRGSCRVSRSCGKTPIEPSSSVRKAKALPSPARASRSAMIPTQITPACQGVDSCWASAARIDWARRTVWVMTSDCVPRSE